MIKCRLGYFVGNGSQIDDAQRRSQNNFQQIERRMLHIFTDKNGDVMCREAGRMEMNTNCNFGVDGGNLNEQGSRGREAANKHRSQ